MRREILFGLGAASLILAVSAASRYAQSADLIDRDTARRAAQVVIGLYLAASGNRMPKSLGKWSSLGAARWSQSVLRVGGWALTLAGLAYATAWAALPLAVARVLGMASVGTGMIIMLGYAAWAFTNCRRTCWRPSPN
jgi:hypothetical protein